MTHTTTAPTLSMGPLLFNWTADDMRDFYFRVADEADLDVVYFGEAVCAKRRPFHLPHYGDIIDRLERGGKRVILSSLQLVMDTKDQAALDDIMAFAGTNMIEANDLSACAALAGTPHALGPSVNVYNEGTLKYFEKEGAKRISLNPELPKASLEALAKAAEAELEVQVFGRAPLAISARCFHARHHGLAKSGCQYVCDKDPDGLAVETLDDQPFLAINGLQTLSHAYLCLTHELEPLKAMGIKNFRLTPHTTDMVQVAALFRDCAGGKTSGQEAAQKLQHLLPDVPLSNGFFHGEAGLSFVA
ncbi:MULTISPECIES: ubiquinone anaerobic biosynthesis protein UbiV [Kordiimonas]|uniref:ubiquinone anaerobic biosynthesis protein UbiV n=1 Tax=Kordiimonas TaxID=288021 RepID=UPI00257BAF83|nr:U32 family peptidase [Kordiimonas sp. UBA4487]